MQRLWHSPRLRYFAVSVALWVLVDWGTAGGFRPSYFGTHGPLLLAFYVGFPLLFSRLCFQTAFRRAMLLPATAATAMFVEGLCTHNPWVLTFPMLVVGIPLALCVYSLLTYLPLWWVEGELRRHRLAAVTLCAVVGAVTALSVLGGR